MPSDSPVVLEDDDYLVRQRAKEIYDEHSEDFQDDLSREIIDGRADEVEGVERILAEARSASQTLSLFEASSMWINEANFLNQTKTGGCSRIQRGPRGDQPFLESLGESKLIISACPIRVTTFIKWLKSNST